MAFHTFRRALHGRHSAAILAVAALGICLPAPAQAKEEGRRGFFRGKASEAEKAAAAEKAVEDMRKFTEGLIAGEAHPAPAAAQKPATPPKPSKPVSPPAAESKPEPKPQIVTAVPDTQAPAKKKRRRLFRSGAEENPAEARVVERPEPAEKPIELVTPTPAPGVAEKTGRRGFLRRPFGGAGNEKTPEPPAAPTKLDPAPEPEAGQSGSLIGRVMPELPDIKLNPFAKSSAKPPAAPTVPPSKPQPDTAVKVEAMPASPEKTAAEPTRRRSLLRSPFGRDKQPPVEPDAVALSSPPKKRLTEPTPPKPAPELSAAKPEPESKAGASGPKGRGLFSRVLPDFKGSEKPRGVPQKPPSKSSRDLGIGEKYVITVDRTPFYSIGPSQPLPPDDILSDGAIVTMRKAGWGWSDVELGGGELGVVATKNLRKATASDLGGSWAARPSSGRSSWRVLDWNPAPEPELPSGQSAAPLGSGLLPPLDPDE